MDKITEMKRESIILAQERICSYFITCRSICSKIIYYLLKLLISLFYFLYFLYTLLDRLHTTICSTIYSFHSKTKNLKIFNTKKQLETNKNSETPKTGSKHTIISDETVRLSEWNMYFDDVSDDNDVSTRSLKIDER